MSRRKTAAILAIGDELLSGRTRDANIHHLAGWLTARGVELLEARIVPDDETAIVAALNALRETYDYVFTSGGIGPTHDDITVDAIAAALGVRVIEHPDAVRTLEAWYGARGQEVTAARRRMARAPEGADLIFNPVSGAPGIKVGNVFVMAGVPRIFEGMLETIEPWIERGAVIQSMSATAWRLPESRLADALTAIQKASPGVALGSYPIDGDVKGVTIVARSEDAAAAARAIEKVAAAMRAEGAEPEFGDPRAPKA